MPKKKYTLLIVVGVIMIALLVAGLRVHHVTKRMFAFADIHSAALTRLKNDLIDRRQSELLVDDYAEVLRLLNEKDIRQAADYETPITIGDMKAPWGDGSATCYVRFKRKRDQKELIAMRLQYNEQSKTYRVLGVVDLEKSNI